MPEPRTFVDFSVDGEQLGRVVFELFASKVPKTAENFRCLCTGEAGVDKVSGKPLNYKGTIVHRVIPDFMIQTGDFTKGTGTGGASIYGAPFEDEDLSLKVDAPGLLVMANRGPNTNSSQWFVTLAPSPHLNGKHVVFGRVVSGFPVFETIAALKTNEKDRPLSDVVISHCGELQLKKAAPKGNDSPPPPHHARSNSVSDDSDVSSVDSRKRKKKSSSRKRSDDSEDDDSDDDKRRRKSKKSKKSKSKPKDKKDKKSSAEKDDEVLNGPPLDRDETDAEIDARLEREDKQREQKRKLEELERLKAQVEKERLETAGGVKYKGRGAMRYRDPEARNSGGYHQPRTAMDSHYDRYGSGRNSQYSRPQSRSNGTGADSGRWGHNDERELGRASLMFRPAAEERQGEPQSLDYDEEPPRESRSRDVEEERGDRLAENSLLSRLG